MRPKQPLIPSSERDQQKHALARASFDCSRLFYLPRTRIKLAIIYRWKEATCSSRSCCRVCSSSSGHPLVRSCLLRRKTSKNDMCIWCVLHGKTLSLKELPSCDSTFSLPSSFFEDEGVTLENLIDWDTVCAPPLAATSTFVNEWPNWTNITMI